MFNTLTPLSRRTPRGRRGTVLAAISLASLVAVAAAAFGVMSASADGRGWGAQKLVGSWMVAVDRGPALPALKSLQTFTSGHGVVEIANGGATARSPSHGAWERTGRREYATTIVFFRYDPAGGAYLGTVKVRRTLVLAPDGQSFTAVSVGELRDPAGNLLPGSNIRRDTEIGERINVEPIP